MNKTKIINALSIAGVDPSGGAGVFADLKAFSALGAYACGVVTAVTAQNTQAVTGIHALPPDFVRRQLDTLFADVQIDTTKIGMLGHAPIVRAVAEGLAGPRASGRLPHVVLDPVMVSKSGDDLLTPDARALLIEAVMPWATVITPNLPEAGALLGQRAPDSLREMQSAAERLRRLLPDTGARWVVLKGGHLSGDAVDVVFDGDQMTVLPGSRIATRHTHGTGCHLSAAIAALLPQGAPVPEVVRRAKAWLTSAIRHGDALNVGQGHGPPHAFHQWWAAL
jgi:hydroxymethylpyrimidine/phosphomethylpyrimidine kinase